MKSTPTSPLLMPVMRCRGRAMRDVVEELIVRASRKEPRFTPLVVNGSRAELLGIVTMVAEAAGFDHRLIVDTDMPKLEALGQDRMQSVSFLRGEAMSHEIQDSFLSGRFNNLRGGIIALEHDPSDTAPRSTRSPKYTWRTEFLARYCDPALMIPAWDLRPGDHEQLITELHQRTVIPRGKRRPTLGSEALKLLIETYPFAGTDAVERALLTATTTCLKMGNRRLRPSHFITRDELAALSSTRSTPDLSRLARDREPQLTNNPPAP